MNGIIYNSKVYISKATKGSNYCIQCDLKKECYQGTLIVKDCMTLLRDGECFLFSQQLTDKLNSK